MTYVVQNEWKFNKDKLKIELNSVLEQYGEIETRDYGLHGIALSSRNGLLQDGFNFNVKIQHPAYQEQDTTDTDPEIYFNLEYARKNKIYHMLDYSVETSACTGYFKEIMNFLHKKNMNPRRARLTCIGSGKEIRTHTDGNFYKIHIPIISDAGNEFIHGQESYELEEGNSYLAYVHPYHKVVNRSSTNRWHFVADVWDLNGNFSIGKISQEKYDQELENASLWRDYVNNKRQFPSKILVGEKN